MVLRKIAGDDDYRQDSEIVGDKGNEKKWKKFVRRNLMVAFLVRGRVCAVVQLLEYSGNSLCICVFQCVY